jgi:hypothetical protein
MHPGVCHLAQFNIARIRYPLEDPRMAGFSANVARVNGLAEQIEGFVWRLQDASGNAMGMTVYDDPCLLPNLTVWNNVQSLERFVWRTLHRRFYERRERWFLPIDKPLVLWFVPAGHRPQLFEGVARLDHFRAHGPTDHAFDWPHIPAAQIWKRVRGTKVDEVAA